MLSRRVTAPRDAKPTPLQHRVYRGGRKPQANALAMWGVAAPLTKEASLLRRREDIDVVRIVFKALEPQAQLSKKLLLDGGPTSDLFCDKSLKHVTGVQNFSRIV